MLPRMRARPFEPPVCMRQRTRSPRSYNTSRATLSQLPANQDDVLTSQFRPKLIQRIWPNLPIAGLKATIQGEVLPRENKNANQYQSVDRDHCPMAAH